MKPKQKKRWKIHATYTFEGDYYVEADTKQYAEDLVRTSTDVRLSGARGFVDDIVYWQFDLCPTKVTIK